jgi:hypothetical protein
VNDASAFSVYTGELTVKLNGPVTARVPVTEVLQISVEPLGVNEMPVAAEAAASATSGPAKEAASSTPSHVPKTFLRMCYPFVER